MVPEVLQKLIAKGDASFGTWTSGAGVMLMEMPEGLGFVITKIRINAFCDLPANNTFADLNVVGNYAWHQLRVIGKKGTNVFHARHKLQLAQNTAAAVCLIPVGYTDFDVFLNQVENIEFELSHFSNGQMTVTPGLLPARLQKPLVPVPPSGYGKTGIAGSIQTTALLRQAANFEIKMFGSLQASVLSRDVSEQFAWSINSTTSLNAPQFTIPFGQLTCPLIQVEYVLLNKKATDTFSKPL